MSRFGDNLSADRTKPSAGDLLVALQRLQNVGRLDSLRQHVRPEGTIADEPFPIANFVDGCDDMISALSPVNFPIRILSSVSGVTPIARATSCPLGRRILHPRSRLRWPARSDRQQPTREARPEG